MDRFRKFFQALSYLQYPLMGLALFYTFKPCFYGFKYLAEHTEVLLQHYNYVLIFMGLGISFSTLQDTKKMQNKLSQKVWEDPKKGKIAIIVICAQIFLFLGYGCIGYFFTTNEQVKELSFGAIVFAIGLIGFLKTALEVFDNHRKDKTADS